MDRVVVVALCTPVHVVTAAFGACGVALLALGSTWPVRVVGVLCLLLVIALIGPSRLLLTARERKERRRLRTPGLMRSPATRALVAEVAALVGSPVPDRLEVVGDFNAFVSRRGRRRALSYGAPLWLTERREERIATLAHELGHFAHGDLLQGWWTANAMVSLAGWHDVFDVDRGADFGPFLSVVTWPVRALLRGYVRLIELAAAPSHRRQEHYADLASAVAAGTTAAVGSLEVLLAAPAVEVTGNAAAIRREDLGSAIRSFGSEYDRERRAASRRRGDVDKSKIDDTHPPTMERIRLLESMAPLAPAVTRTEEEWTVIEAEWESTLSSQLAKLAERYRYRR